MQHDTPPAAADQPPPSKQAGAGVFYGWYVVAGLSVTLFLGMGVLQGFGVFIEAWENEFGVSVATISIAASLAVLVNGLSQPFFGTLVDRVGGRAVIIPAFAALGVAALLMALVGNVYFLIALYGIGIAVAAGGASPVTTTAVAARWFQRRRGTAISLVSAGASGGGLIIIPFLAFLLVAAGWQTAWIVFGAILLVVGLPLLFFVLRNDPRDLGLHPDGDSAEGAADVARSLPQPPLHAEQWRHSFRSAPIWQLALTYVVCGVTTQAIGVHFVRWAGDEGIGIGTAALAFSLLSAVNLVGVLVVGSFSDRTQRKTLLGLAYAVRFFAFVALVVLPGPTAIWVFAIVGGGSWLVTVPLTNALAADIYGLKHFGVLSGLVFMSHQIGGAAAVLIYGIVFDATGSYDPAFIASAVLLVFASLGAFSIRERRYSVRFAAPAHDDAPDD